MWADRERHYSAEYRCTNLDCADYGTRWSVRCYEYNGVGEVLDGEDICCETCREEGESDG